MFQGHFFHTLDPKGRVSIPAEYRLEFQRQSELPPTLTTFEDHLALYPSEEWRKFTEKLLSSPQLRPEVADLEDYLFSGAHPCPIDKQGRIAIPEVCREEASLVRDVVFAGAGNRVKIWDKERFHAHRAELHKRYKELAAVVSSVGQES